MPGAARSRQSAWMQRSSRMHARAQVWGAVVGWHGSTVSLLNNGTVA